MSLVNRSRREKANLPQIGTFMETAGIEPALCSRRVRPGNAVVCREIGAARRSTARPRHRRSDFDAGTAYRRGRPVIYFIQAKTPDRPGPIKIGYTAKAKIWERVNELQTGCPWELVVLRATPVAASGRSAHESY